MIIYYVNYFKVDDMEHEYENEQFHFLNEQDARNKFKELVNETIKEIIDEYLFEDSNPNGYETPEELIEQEEIDLETNKLFCWYDDCGYSELQIEIKEVEIK